MGALRGRDAGGHRRVDAGRGGARGGGRRRRFRRGGAGRPVSHRPRARPMTALVVALAAGAVVGLALGGLGGGGSVLAVPALIYLLGFDPAAATTAGLLIVIATSLT
ncbi:TSUP family transporter, partial [Streptomyces sp. NPDC058240]|uniref:TSUP family transporter n=1 Tax=Streptomyces sp. NPDC058240 TaxID=3346396 RepID=UPI0036F0657D